MPLSLAAKAARLLAVCADHLAQFDASRSFESFRTGWGGAPDYIWFIVHKLSLFDSIHVLKLIRAQILL